MLKQIFKEKEKFKFDLNSTYINCEEMKIITMHSLQLLFYIVLIPAMPFIFTAIFIQEIKHYVRGE